MSAWRGKYAIGLTGNIATGKSVVRRMLEHMGAYGIDADALGHRAMAKGAPGYNKVTDAFGKWILSLDGQINRTKLARIVFNDPEALAVLESIIHPLVAGAVDILVRRSKHKVVVIEAIKLLESELVDKCDTVWVIYAPESVQIDRLTRKRALSREESLERITAQIPQQERIKQADIVIRNDGSFENTWRQVESAWKESVPEIKPITEVTTVPSIGEMKALRAGPAEAAVIAAFITKMSAEKRKLNRSDVMAAFGEKAYMQLNIGSKTVGLAGWQVENLVARVDELYLEPDNHLEKALQVMIEAIESASRELQCEIILMFLSPYLAQKDKIWDKLGYKARSISGLSVNAWQEAAIETMPPGTVMFMKQLRKDRVLRPI